MIGTMQEFRHILIEDVNAESLKEIGKMHLDYVRYSRDTSFTVPQVFEIIQAVVTQPNLPFQFWIGKDGDKFTGFALTEFLHCPKGIELDIKQAYIDPKYRSFETQKQAIEVIERFAESKGAVYLITSTLRDPMEAFIRWMKRVGFKKQCVIVSKELRRKS